MKKVPLIIAILLFCQSIYSQQIFISTNTLYGTFKMGSVKDVQQSNFIKLKEQSIPVEKIEEYPSNFGFNIDGVIYLENTYLGISFEQFTTGGRIGYADYSGVISYDETLTGYGLYTKVGKLVTLKNDHKLLIGVFLGNFFTELKQDHSFIVTDVSVDIDKEEYNSRNFCIGPEINFTYNIKFFNLYINTILRYDLQFPSNLTMGSNQGHYALNDYFQNVTADWSGIRIGAGIGYLIKYNY